MAHRIVKRIYRLSSKLNATRQIAQRYLRTAFAQRETLSTVKDSNRPSGRRRTLLVGRDPLGYVPPEQHHFISPSRKNPIKLFHFLSQNHQDPALKVETIYTNLFNFLI